MATPLSTQSEPVPASAEEIDEPQEYSPEETETDQQSPAPGPSPPTNPFDPLHDILGIDSSTAGNGHGSPAQQQNMAVQVYAAGTGMPGMHHPATIENTVADRVANVKGIMANSGMTAGQHHTGGFGVNGANMHAAMHGGQSNPYAQQQSQQQAQLQAQQQMYNTMAMQQYQQQQQQIAAYQTMAYQTMAYQSMAHNQQVALYHGQQQNAGNGMYGMGPMNGMQRMGMMATYTPAPQGNQSVPVMQAERQTMQPKNFRVQKGTKPTRVSDSDVAFGPLLDRMKKQVSSNKQT